MYLVFAKLSRDDVEVIADEPVLVSIAARASLAARVEAMNMTRTFTAQDGSPSPGRAPDHWARPRLRAPWARSRRRLCLRICAVN